MGTAVVTMPALGSITIASVQNPVMGVKYSGFNEQNQVSVLLLDTSQKPYPDGLEVRFEHQQLGRSTISTPLAPDSATCLQASGCLAYIGKTASPPDKPDTLGIATVNLYSGTAAGPVSVSVTADAGGATRNFTVSNISIIGAKASGAHISLICTPANVPGYVQTDGHNSTYTGPGDVITCTVYLADRFNNVLGVATRAEFRTEAGSAGPPVLTKAFDPNKTGDQTADLGHAANSITVTGYPLPIDVNATNDEFSREYDAMDGFGVRTHNPRDGLSSIMVFVTGEEGFVDLNGNGTYDPGEPFIDSSEPLVDSNDNNVWDEGEDFIDVNQNGKWDGPNGVWDANAVIWAETRVVYTGLPTQTRWLALNATSELPGPTDTVAFDVTAMPPTSERFYIFFSDNNYNQMATHTVYTLTALEKNVTAQYSQMPSTLDQLGMSFTQLYCDRHPPAKPSVCVSTCTSVPCYRVSNVDNWQYGTLAQAVITGAKVGSDTVQATATIAGVMTNALIFGNVQ
jgi:hypothetical protein